MQLGLLRQVHGLAKAVKESAPLSQCVAYTDKMANERSNDGLRDGVSVVVGSLQFTMTPHQCQEVGPAIKLLQVAMPLLPCCCSHPHANTRQNDPQSFSVSTDARLQLCATQALARQWAKCSPHTMLSSLPLVVAAGAQPDDPSAVSNAKLAQAGIAAAELGNRQAT